MVWLFPSHPSEAARCASTGDHQAPSPLLLREQVISTGVLPSFPSSVPREQEDDPIRCLSIALRVIGKYLGGS